MRWPARSSSTTTSAPTCTAWRGPGRRRAAGRAGARRSAPSTVRLVEAMAVPAVVLGRRTDVLAWNARAHALLAGHYGFDARPNLTRMLFLDAHTRELYRDWDEEAARAVASLRLVAGRFPDDRELAELVGELSVKSAEFAALWSRHPVASCVSGVKRLRHPEVGELELEFQVLNLPDDSGQRILTYTGADLELLR